MINRRSIDTLLLVLYLLLGMAAGHLAANALGLWLRPGVTVAPAAERPAAASRRRAPLSDYEVVVQRNLFDSSSQGVLSLASGQSGPQAQPAETPAAPARRDLALLGTIAGGPKPLAVIRAGGELGIFHLGQEVPGGGRIEAILRNLVHIRHPDDSLEELPLYREPSQAEEPAPPSVAGKGPAEADTYAVQQVGNNRWVIPQAEAERARQNLGDLLKTARVVPNVVDGRTDGFKVVAVRPRSILDLLGVRQGDVLMGVNGLELNSPEKALQIFQQLREAKTISLSLVRGSQRLTFDYEIN